MYYEGGLEQKFLLLEKIHREDGSNVDQRSRRPALSRQSQHVPISAPDSFDEEYDDIWPSQMPSSVRRYSNDARMESGYVHGDVQDNYHFVTTNRGNKSSVPPRRSATQAMPAVAPANRRPLRDTEDIPLSLQRQGSERYRFHWLVYLGLALFVMMIGWFLLTGLVNWWQSVQDDWHYGRPRTFQTDYVVGHNDSSTTPSHFIALNLNRHVQVVEFPGNDPSKAKVYVGPLLTGPGQDLAPVTLAFKDVNGDGKVDMIVNVQDSHFVFINDGEQFRPPRPGEKIQ